MANNNQQGPIHHITTKEIQDALQVPLASISYLTFKQVSDITGFSRPLIDQLIKDEGLPVERFRSRMAFNVAELEKWFAKRRQEEREAKEQESARVRAWLNKPTNTNTKRGKK